MSDCLFHRVILKLLHVLEVLGLSSYQIIQAHGGTVDPTLTSRCTHLLCESQVSNMYAQVSKLVTCVHACFHFITRKVGLFSMYFMLRLQV